jgi:hypothetical protein
MAWPQFMQVGDLGMALYERREGPYVPVGARLNRRALSMRCQSQLSYEFERR